MTLPSPLTESAWCVLRMYSDHYKYCTVHIDFYIRWKMSGLTFSEYQFIDSTERPRRLWYKFYTNLPLMLPRNYFLLPDTYPWYSIIQSWARVLSWESSTCCEIATGKAVFRKLLGSQNLDLSCSHYVIPTVLYIWKLHDIKCAASEAWKHYNRDRYHRRDHCDLTKKIGAKNNKF
jgi:hypothetical protein